MPKQLPAASLCSLKHQQVDTIKLTGIYCFTLEHIAKQANLMSATMDSKSIDKTPNYLKIECASFRSA